MHGSPIPQSLCDRAKLLSMVHCSRTVMELTGLCSSSLWRIKRRGWKALPAGFKHRRRPSDFAIQARHMPSHELAAHYHASNTTVARWKRELAQ